MSKMNSPSSNNSATSSETSETQSVDDTTSGNNTRVVKSWKRMKDEGEKKRPPWQSVSVSTLPKADKNALLRAKLLDASRRLRLSKLSIGVQVELPIYQPSRNVGIPIQRDLIPTYDVGILTDGSITIKKEGPGEFILTHSASQMTEGIVGNEKATQTLIPRSTKCFLEAYLESKPSDKEYSLTENERRLLNQIRDIRKIDEQLCQKFKHFDEMSDDSISSCGDKTEIKQYFEEVAKKSGSLLKPTLSSWYFEYSNENQSEWKPFTNKPTPWSSFANTEIEDRLTNMKLQPPIEKKKQFQIQEIALNLELFAALEELINESHNLLDTFNRLSLKAGPVKVNPNTTTPIESFEIRYASDYWLPIIENQEERTRNLESQLKYPKVYKAEPLPMPFMTKELPRQENNNK